MTDLEFMTGRRRNLGYVGSSMAKVVGEETIAHSNTKGMLKPPANRIERWEDLMQGEGQKYRDQQHLRYMLWGHKGDMVGHVTDGNVKELAGSGRSANFYTGRSVGIMPVVDAHEVIHVIIFTDLERAVGQEQMVEYQNVRHNFAIRDKFDLVPERAMFKYNMQVCTKTGGR